MRNQSKVDYDIWNKQKALLTLKNILNEPLGEKLKSLKNDDDKVNTLLAQWDLSETRFWCYHITTSNNNCSNVRKYGLTPLRKVLENETELSSFLNKHLGLKYCKTNNRFIRKDGTPLLFPPASIIPSKLKSDNRISAFLFVSEGNYDEYEKSPEILRNLCSACKKNNLAAIWEKQHNPISSGFLFL